MIYKALQDQISSLIFYHSFPPVRTPIINTYHTLLKLPVFLSPLPDINILRAETVPQILFC